ncbi:MAG: ATP-binding protein [Spirochaetales bacterium]|nr:ATP-binding protein [Spirochaetales bacterium]
MFKRRLEISIIKFYNSETNLLITGPRQAGKTTLLSKLIPQDLGKKFYYITFDNPDTRLELATDAFRKLEGINTEILIFDEIQKMPEILDLIKLFIDTNNRRHHYLTGSAQVLLLKKIQESLAGRIGIWNLYPLSLYETLNFKTSQFLDLLLKKRENTLKKNFTVSIDKSEHITKNLDIIQRWGGFPAVWNLKSDEERYRWLLNYKKTYLDKDIRELSNGTDILRLTRFINILADRSGNILSLSDIARDTGVSVTTSKNYIRLLELSYQIYLLKPYFENSSKRFIKSPKVFFLDSGLLRVISGTAQQDKLSGSEYETWVFTELLKWISAKAIPPEIFYYRTSGGFEIDFLLRYNGLLFPIEVKNRGEIHSADISRLKRFKAEYREKCGPGIVVYTGRQVISFNNDIYAVPDRVLFT